jgi:hypothetical protein
LASRAQAADAHFKVDLHCLVCLQPLIEPQVLVPCGHSICIKCSQALDQVLDPPPRPRSPCRLPDAGHTLTFSAVGASSWRRAARPQAAAQSAGYGPPKACPLCTQQRAEELGGSLRRGAESEGDEAPQVEQFPNQMLDTVTTRMRAKTLDVQTLLNYVLGIFNVDKGGRPLPLADSLRQPVAQPPVKSAPVAAA